MTEGTRYRLQVARNARKNGDVVELLYAGHRLEVADISYNDQWISLRLGEGGLLTLDPGAEFALITTERPAKRDIRNIVNESE